MQVNFIYFKKFNSVQQQVPLPLPCYDFTLITTFTFTYLIANNVKLNKLKKLMFYLIKTIKMRNISNKSNFLGVTGGVY